MRNQVLGAVFVLSLAMNLGVLGMAAYDRYGHGAEPVVTPPAGPTLREELRLTDDQVRAFTGQRDALNQRMEALRSRMHQHRQQFFTLLAVPVPDAIAIDGVLKELNRTQYDMQRAAADYLLVQKRLLTPEQASAFVRIVGRQPGTEERPAHFPLMGPGGALRPDDPR